MKVMRRLGQTWALSQSVEEGPRALQERFGGLAHVAPEVVVVVLHAVEGEERELGPDLRHLPSLVARVLPNALAHALPHLEPRLPLLLLK
jgi:hypothetical protein